MKSKQMAMIEILLNAGWRVDDTGRVVRPDGQIRKTRLAKGKGSRTDYLAFNVKDGKMARPIMVHRMAARQRFGDYDPALVVRHLNGDSLDNSVENIAIGTHSENIYDRPQEDRRDHGRRAALTKRKLSDADIAEIRSSPLSGNAMAKKFGVVKSTISNVRAGRSYAHLIA